MKTSKVQQFGVIRETDPDKFETKLNEKMERLAGESPKAKVDVSGEILYATIEYYKRVAYDDPGEEDKTIYFTCGDCPMFSPPLKSDGTPDLRTKWGCCPHADMHRTRTWSSACEVLYKMIKNGDIVLALNKLEE